MILNVAMTLPRTVSIKRSWPVGYCAGFMIVNFEVITIIRDISLLIAFSVVEL